MHKKLEKFMNKNKSLLIFIPIYLLFIFVTDFVLGISMGNNDAWDKGVKKTEKLTRKI